MNVLLTNDDGINSPGLRALYSALKRAGHNVLAVAPMRQQSGVGHSLTVFQPLQIKNISEDGGFEGIGVFGTPTDCVKLGLGSLVPWQADLVMAGINEGHNVGPDIHYSGTVGAAAEGAHASLPSMAVSHASHTGCADIDAVAEHAVRMAEAIDWQKIPHGTVINVNYPDIGLCDAQDPVVCGQSSAVWKNVYNEREDPRGGRYWWLIGAIDKNADVDSDMVLLAKGHITVTPLKFDFTDRGSLAALESMNLASRIK